MSERMQEPSDVPRRSPTTCPDCACGELTLISDSPIATVLKCPRCGKLLAPVKKH